MELLLKSGQTVILDDDVSENIHKFSWTTRPGQDRVITSWREGRKTVQRTLNEFASGITLEKGQRYVHLDGDPWNFREENISVESIGRSLAPEGQMHDARPNGLGFRGVALVGNKYRALGSRDGKQVYLGLHDTPEQAAEAYDTNLIAQGKKPINFPTL